MNIYVAGRFKKYQEVRAVIDQLKENGHTITHDWTRTEEFDENGIHNDAESGGEILPLSKQQKYASDDLNGVYAAEALVMCADDDGMIGTYIEFGAALAKGLDVVIINPSRWSIFFALPGVTVVEDVEEAMLVVDNIDSMAQISASFRRSSIKSSL